MVPDIIRVINSRATGRRRVRFERNLLGIHTIIEDEYEVDYGFNPFSNPVRRDLEWQRVKLWDAFGQTFYLGAR